MFTPNSPFWPLLRLIVVMVTLVLILMLTASKFDNTELKTIIVTFGAAAGIEGWSHFMQRK